MIVILETTHYLSTKIYFLLLMMKHFLSSLWNTYRSLILINAWKSVSDNLISTVKSHYKLSVFLVTLSWWEWHVTSITKTQSGRIRWQSASDTYLITDQSLFMLNYKIRLKMSCNNSFLRILCITLSCLRY